MCYMHNINMGTYRRRESPETPLSDKNYLKIKVAKEKSNYSAASVGSFHKNRHAGSRMKQGDKRRKELMLNRLIL